MYIIHLQLLALPGNHQRPQKMELKFVLVLHSTLKYTIPRNGWNNLLIKKNSLKIPLKLLVHVSGPGIAYSLFDTHAHMGMSACILNICILNTSIVLYFGVFYDPCIFLNTSLR